MKENSSNKKEYSIIPIFKEKGESFEEVVQKAFIKYLKFNDYKQWWLLKGKL